MCNNTIGNQLLDGKKCAKPVLFLSENCVENQNLIFKTIYILFFGKSGRQNRVILGQYLYAP